MKFTPKAAAANSVATHSAALTMRSVPGVAQ